MGSYLMACAVTGATITEGAEVVAFEMQPEERHGRGSQLTFNSVWFISEFPHHGVYNDYGNVLLSDGSEVNSTDSNLMIMYKWAWEVLVDLVNKSNEENDARYVEYNKQGLKYENYRLKYIADAKEAIDTHIKNSGNDAPKEKFTIEKLQELLASAKDLEEKKKLAASFYETLVSGRVTESALRWGGEGCQTSDDFWRKKILESADPHAAHDKFREEVLVITQSTNFIFFRLMPSVYGSQDSNADELIKLYERGLEYFREYASDDAE